MELGAGEFPLPTIHDFTSGRVKSLGWGVLNWISTYLGQPNAQWKAEDKPFTLTNEQALFVLRWYAIKDDGSFYFADRAILERPKGWGKLCEDNTPVPTPRGFVLHGDLRAGDFVYGEHGQSVKVLKVHDAITDFLYEVEFSDGSVIVAHANHDWVVEEFVGAAKRRRVTLSTIEMLKSGLVYDRPLTHGKTKATSGGVAKFRVINQPAVAGTHKDLPVDPYSLGYWLGDGHSDQPYITVHNDDLQSLLSHMQTRWHKAVGPNIHKVRWDIKSDSLRQLGVLNNKHIPQEYLLASERQRRDLLSGVIDSDGHVEKSGRVEIALCNKALAHDVLRLVRSLGYIASMTTSPAKLYGRETSTRHRIKFTAFSGELCRLQRKSDRLKARPVVPYSTTRTVKRITQQTKTSTGRCITVEGGIYLVGERYVPTHNSPLLAALCCVELLGPVRFDYWDLDGQPIGRPEYQPLIQVAAISEAQADNTFKLVILMLNEGLVYNAYDLQGCVWRTKVELRGATGLIERVTSSPAGREGQRVTFACVDETHLWLPSKDGPELFEAIERNALKMDARMVETTNAPVPGEGSVAEISYNAVTKLYSEAESWKSVDILLDTKQVVIEDIYDPEQAIPALEYVYGDSSKDRGGWINLPRFWSKINSPSTRESVARRFYFNEKVQGGSNWLEKRFWDACNEPTLSLQPGEKYTMGFVGAIRNGAAGIVAYRLRDGALFNVGLWEKPEDMEEDWEVPFASVDYRIRSMLESEDCLKLVASPENWQEIVGRWYGDYDEKVLELWLTKNKAKHAAAVEQFETAVFTKRIKWNDPSLNRHVLQCHTVDINLTASEQVENPPHMIRKETPHSTRYISLAQAALLAVEAGVIAIEEGALADDEEHFIYSY